ncbi:MAG TPA: HD domain-containing phosphohydrolase [Pyrinomonadaceae bacterium]|nr:HD domain-containing phosphohydrolase [Pyrinomonadaceae bacterium]
MPPAKNEFNESERAAHEAFARLASAVDEFEAYAHPHALRVAKIADEVARLFRLSAADRASLVSASLLHDIGEMAMGRDYIKRAGALTEEERLDLGRHPVIGEQEAARVGADRGAQLLVRWHHEWWNGAGYPDALRGEQIPLKARILRASDAYAALTDARPHRPALTEEEARRHLAEWAGLEFDPRVVRALLSLRGAAELRSFAREREALDVRETAQPLEVAPSVEAATDKAATDEAATLPRENATPAREAEGQTVEVGFGSVPPELKT